MALPRRRQLLRAGPMSAVAVALLTLGSLLLQADQVAAQQSLPRGRVLIANASDIPQLLQEPARAARPTARRPAGQSTKGGQAVRRSLLVAPKPVPMRRPGVATLGGLHLAASHGQLKAVEALLKKRKSLDSQDAGGNTALVLAVAAGQQKIVRTLLAAGARTDLLNSNGESALSLAVRRQRLGIVELLIEQGALSKIQASARAVIEREAVRSCRRELIQAVFGSRGAGQSRGELPLSIAAAHCDPRLLIDLLTLSTSVRSGIPAGHKAMFEAIRHGNIPALKILLGQDVAPNILSESGAAPLNEAAMRGLAAGVQVLLAKGADIDHVTAAGNTSLMLAGHAGSESSLLVLIKNGANLDLRNQYGLTALMIAAQAGRVKIAQELIAAGANTKLRNSRGDTAIELARAAGHKDLAQLLRSPQLLR